MTACPKNCLSKIVVCISLMPPSPPLSPHYYYYYYRLPFFKKRPTSPHYYYRLPRARRQPMMWLVVEVVGRLRILKMKTMVRPLGINSI